MRIFDAYDDFFLYYKIIKLFVAECSVRQIKPPCVFFIFTGTNLLISMFYKSTVKLL